MTDSFFIVNGERVRSTGRPSLSELASLYLPDAGLALLNGRLVDPVMWDDVLPNAGSEIVFARRGVMPDEKTYLRLMTSRNPPGVVDKLAAATVGIAGCGGLGSHAAVALARLGVGSLVLADFDIVEPTNLNRQVYTAGDIGAPKAEALARLIAGINPLVRLCVHNIVLRPENIPGIFRDCRVVLECLDNSVAKRMLVENILTGVPKALVVAASGLGGLGPAEKIVTRRAMTRLWVVGDGESAVEEGHGLSAPRVMIAAGQQALCAANILLDQTESL